MNKPKILFAGDSPLGGPANYLAAILNLLPSDWTHIPPSEKLTPSLLQETYDSIILSDFPKNQLPNESEKIISQQVENGTGLLMVGGWASFSGIYGQWKGSLIESLLPIECLDSDDRLNIPSGAVIKNKASHSLLESVDFSHPPIICGLNQLKVKPSGQLLLSAIPLHTELSSKGQLQVGINESSELPLLVINSDKQLRTAALATDIAPHWCGGFVDWGKKRLTLKANESIQVEVGNLYVELLSNLFSWVSNKS